MLFRQHVPAEPLARYVDWLWFYDDLFPPHRRERVLPDGTFELIINLRDEPRHLFERGGRRGDTVFRDAWLSGAHSQYIVIDALPASSMIGVHFKPGGAAMFGLQAHELHNEVVALEAICGAAASSVRDEILAARTAEAKFAALERWLQGRLRQRRADARVEQRVFWMRDRLVAAMPPRISDLAAEAGMSHRRLIAEFRAHVGLTPKRFCRVRRFQHALAELAARRTIDWSDVACTCGYFDQAHFVHDFRAFSGFRPTEYLGTGAIEHGNFIPVEEP